MTITRAITLLGKWGRKVAPTALAIAGSAGVIVTGISAAKAGMKYEKTKDKRVFIKPVITGAVTITCILTGDRMHVRRNAAIAGAASIVQRQYDKYVNAMEPDIDPLVRDDRDMYTAEDIWRKCQKNGIQPIDTHTGTKLWFEPISEQFFLASTDHVTDAINKIVDDFDGSGYAIAGEFIRYLELPVKPGFNSLIWDRDLGETFYGYSTIQIGMRDKKLRDGTEYTQIYYVRDPHLSDK